MTVGEIEEVAAGEIEEGDIVDKVGMKVVVDRGTAEFDVDRQVAGSAAFAA